MSTQTEQHNLHGPREQFITLLLYVLRDLDEAVTRQNTLVAIENARFFDAVADDLNCYRGNDERLAEPRWYVFITSAYHDAVARGYLVKHTVPDCWHISEDGRRELNQRFAALQKGGADVRSCYLWTQKFKRVIDPTYCPSDRDAQRPASFYKDYAPRWLYEDIRRTAIVDSL